MGTQKLLVRESRINLEGRTPAVVIRCVGIFLTTKFMYYKYHDYNSWLTFFHEFVITMFCQLNE